MMRTTFLGELAHVEDVPVPAGEGLVGRKLGRFRILAELGRGGMGIVYLAHDQQLRRSVALKLLRQSLTQDDERYRRFLREAQAAAAVKHPHLATIYDVGEVEGQAFIAIEPLDGKSLRRVLASGPLPFDEAVRVARQILAGLDEAHRAGFSFGVLLYEMVAGVRPFVAESPAELHSAILRDAPRRLGELRPLVPPRRASPSYKGWDPTYGMETNPERLCELLEAMLDVAQAPAAATSASRLTP
jgi:serine/threonine protein kinase